MQLSSGHHLSYCTNIHPGESWEAVFHNLQEYLPRLKKELSPDKPFGIGLRLSDKASRELAEGAKLSSFSSWLSQHGLYVYTMNGFPYGGFHNQEVKDAVHAPDWTTTDRLAYTARLARILSVILPEGMQGGISTSPLTYRLWHKTEAETNAAFQKSCEHLTDLVETLLLLKAETGKAIHIDIEPEPDGLLENTAEFISFYTKWLLPVGTARLQEKGLPEQEAEEAIRTHIQLCYDVCHFALVYEKPAEVFAKMKAAGIRIGKMQLSAALKVALPESATEREAVAERLAPFVESTYLHQVIARDSQHRLTHYPDLPQALEQLSATDAREWRTHFHVPLFTDSYHGLLSTQDEIAEVLELLKREHLTDHLEVETYTWEVLPEDMKKPLHDSILRELEWVLQTIQK